MSYRKAPIKNTKLFEDQHQNGKDKVTCPKCKGKGCPHCDNKGYHLEESYLNEQPQQLNEDWWENIWWFLNGRWDAQHWNDILNWNQKMWDLNCGAGVVSDYCQGLLDAINNAEDELQKLREKYPNHTDEIDGGGGGEAEAATMPTIPSGIASRLGKDMPNIGSTVRESFESRWNRENRLNEQTSWSDKYGNTWEQLPGEEPKIVRHWWQNEDSPIFRELQRYMNEPQTDDWMPPTDTGPRPRE